MPIWAPDVGIDLGTETTSVYVRGRGIIINEPTLVVLDAENRKVVRAVGDEAAFMIGRNPEKLIPVYPIRNGQVSDFDITEMMLKYFIRKANGFSIRKTCFPPASLIASVMAFLLTSSRPHGTETMILGRLR